MTQSIDFGLLDRPQILQYVFYPRRDWTATPAGATDHLVPVGDGISIACRLYVAEPDAATIVYFHGNGEVVSDHDWIAPLFNAQGLNLFVADYRGYGRSDGSPSFANMTADAHTIFARFSLIVQASNFTGPVFVMGRSLGSHSALELARGYPGSLCGAIIESGFASPSRLLGLLGASITPAQAAAFETASIERIRGITVPLLILHGERDSLIPVEQAVFLHAHCGTPDKKLVVIPGAEHNDIMIVGGSLYFSSIREFVTAHLTPR